MEQPTFVSIPRRMAVYCENCDTVSVAVAAGARCGVCGSIATVPLSYFLKPTSANQPVGSTRAA